MDHKTGHVFVVSLSETTAAAASQAEDWLDATATQLQHLAHCNQANAGTILSVSFLALLVSRTLAASCSVPQLHSSVLKYGTCVTNPYSSQSVVECFGCLKEFRESVWWVPRDICLCLHCRSFEAVNTLQSSGIRQPTEHS